MNHHLFVLFINIIATWLSFLVFINDPRRKVNRLFVLMSITMLGWVDFSYISRITRFDAINSIVFLRIGWAFTPLFLLCMYFFVLDFIGHGKKNSFLDKMIIFFMPLLSLVSLLTDKVVKTIHVTNDILFIDYGSLIFFFLLGVVLILLGILGIFFVKYEEEHFEVILKNRVFFIGISIFFVFNTIFNIVLPIFLNISQYYYGGDYSTIIFLFFVTYLILKDNFLGVKAVTITFFVSVILVLISTEIIFLTKELEIKIYKSSVLLTFFIFSIFLIRNILDEIKKNIKLESVYAELDILNHAKMDFLSMASHQLRTPISIIRGSVSMLEEGDYGSLTKEEVDVVHRIMGNVEKLAEVVNDILSVAHIETGTMLLNANSSDFILTVKQIVDLLTSSAEEKDISLLFDSQIDSLFLKYDVNKIYQALFNVVDNSIKYTEKGFVKISIISNEDYYIFTVEDTGIGIPPEHLKVIFSKFLRGENAKMMRPDGSGIGLFLVKNILDLHGWEIKVESPVISENEQKNGTRTTILIPKKTKI